MVNLLKLAFATLPIIGIFSMETTTPTPEESISTENIPVEQSTVGETVKTGQTDFTTSEGIQTAILITFFVVSCASGIFLYYVYLDPDSNELSLDNRGKITQENADEMLGKNLAEEGGRNY